MASDDAAHFQGHVHLPLILRIVVLLLALLSLVQVLSLASLLSIVWLLSLVSSYPRKACPRESGAGFARE
jgi:hypothetical protein